MSAFSNDPKATIDFETRSAAELGDVGSWVYSKHPSTEVLVLCYRLPYWEPDRVEDWYPDFPEHGIDGTAEPVELFNWIRSGGLVEAHNAFFERCIWQNVMVPRYSWPTVPGDAWRCSAAKAAAHSLPRNLEMLCKALGTPQQKDVEGAKTMKKMAKPRKPKKAEVLAYAAEHKIAFSDWKELVERMPVLWHFDETMFLDVLVPYCRQDVRAEESCSHRLRDLSRVETEVYLMDQRINERGVQLDRAAVETALELVGEVYVDLNAELVRVTGGQVERATQRARIVEWLHVNGVPITDTQGATVDEWLKRRDLPPKSYRVLELMRALGRSSTAKYEAFRNYADPDDWRIRGTLLYHGAGTGRWAGAGPQPHNFPRGSIKDMALAWSVIQTKDMALIEALYDDLMTLLSHALRGAIVARPGRKLVAADYAAIEARVIFWLADDQAALDIFRRGECIYCDMASGIYKRPIVKPDPKRGIAGDPDERQMGKQAILGLGFQMGWNKFVDTCAKYGIFIEPEFAKYVVDTYRGKYWRVKQMWWDQEAAALEAVRTGRTIRCGRIQWRVIDDFLFCKLPSGRTLAYPYPRIVKKLMPWSSTDFRDALSFMGVDPYTKKWIRQDTYGGTLVENIVQATARDLMADAMLRCEETGVYDVVLSVHDELVTEVEEGAGSAKALEKLMSQVPVWAEGCPVVAEGWEGPRYRK